MLILWASGHPGLCEGGRARGPPGLFRPGPVPRGPGLPPTAGEGMKRCRHRRFGWLRVPVVFPSELARWVWACLDCRRWIGTGPGAIPWRWRYAAEEDVGVWDDDE